MKGSVFKHFESFVCENWSVEVFEEILDEAELKTSGPFLAPQNYPDEDLLAIVGVAIAKLNVPLPDALRAFGKYLFFKLAEEAPYAFVDVASVETFLNTIDDVIHVEVKKTSPLAKPPRVEVHEAQRGRAKVSYHSDRRLCQLFIGLVEGAAERFSSEVEFEELECTHRGDERCLFDFRFRDAA